MIGDTFIVPQVHGKDRPRTRVFGKHAIIYTAKATKDYEALIRKCASDAGIGYHNRVKVVTCINLPVTIKEYKTKKHIIIEPTRRPDTDNVQKSILDAIEGIAYKNDKYVLDQRSYYNFTLGGEPSVESRIIPVTFTDYLTLPEGVNIYDRYIIEGDL